MTTELLENTLQAAPAAQMDFNTNRIFHELDWSNDRELVQAAKDCFEAQKAFAQKNFDYRPDMNSLIHVSPESLEESLRNGTEIDGIHTHRDITNAVIFNFRTIAHSVTRKDLMLLRKKVDRLIVDRVKKVFANGSELSAWNSGNFWYPPFGFMGWHTNVNLPGWRLYINYAEEPGKSFFRYRDPETGELVTSHDKVWNFRLFRVTADKPLWHAIHSDTNRFSLGYVINLKSEIKKRYAAVYNGGYESCVAMDCLNGYEWLRANYPEEYDNRWHRLRAYSTKSRAVWRVVKHIEEKQVLHRAKSFFKGAR